MEDREKFRRMAEQEKRLSELERGLHRGIELDTDNLHRQRDLLMAERLAEFDPAFAHRLCDIEKEDRLGPFWYC